MIVYIVSIIIIAANIAVLFYIGNGIRYDYYLICSGFIIAALSFACGWFEAKRHR